MEKNKKVFYFDFIRVISTVIIVTYHFFAHFDENGIKGMRFLSDGKWGMIGVTLFFMLSGASLMYNYGEKLDIKKYALKRFLGIYPMFWIAYIGVFTYIFYGCKRIIWDIPKYKILFSLFAMDGYLSPYTQTFYLIGEWFLGCIVFIYVLFPFLRIALEKQPVITSVVFTILNFSAVIFLKNTKMPINKNLIVCSYSFFLGMLVVKYIKKIKWYYAVLALFAAGAVYLIPEQSSLNMKTLCANIIGYALFIVLAFIGQSIKEGKFTSLVSLLGKYSYAVFLVHHYIIMKMESTFQNADLQKTGTLVLYITCWIVIGIFAKLLFVINKSVVGFFRKPKDQA